MTADDNTRKQNAREARLRYERKCRKVSIRFKADEYSQLTTHADRSGKEISTYIHDVSLNPSFRIVPAPPQVNIETKAIIQRIGVNLNQMTRSINNYYEHKNLDQIRSELAAIAATLREILLKI